MFYSMCIILVNIRFGSWKSYIMTVVFSHIENLCIFTIKSNKPMTFPCWIKCYIHITNISFYFTNYFVEFDGLIFIFPWCLFVCFFIIIFYLFYGDMMYFKQAFSTRRCLIFGVPHNAHDLFFVIHLNVFHGYGVCVSTHFLKTAAAFDGNVVLDERP